MQELLRREHQTEVRNRGRTLSGIAVPFDQVTDLGYEREVFRYGAFTKTIAQRGERIPFMIQHDGRTLPIGKLVAMQERSEGLYIEAAISDTQAGRDALTLIEDGVVSGLSIGFKVVNDHYPERDLREIVEAALMEVSLVAFPAYEGAKVLSVRSARQMLQERPTGLSIAKARQELEKFGA